ncbi:MAG: hypothetical protein KKH94_09365 [Candidatus Omnitrophica bacterium]|nr:hypothetical protein [Candidatus Omnitrophota bacterium]
MLTLFTIPKSFNGHINVIQRNAITSWTQLKPRCEVILFGDDEGVAEFAREVGVTHVSDIAKNEHGTPLLSSAFTMAKALAHNEIIGYVNSDIVILSDFIQAVAKVTKPFFLMSGRRWDLDIKNRIDFIDNWEEKIRLAMRAHGCLHGFSGIDYFIFPRTLTINLPEFAVGRPGWDNWFIWDSKQRGIPVIDATEMITAIHQNHGYSHLRGGWKDWLQGPESKNNFTLAGGLTQMLTLRDADWVLKSDGVHRPSFPNLLFSSLSRFYMWRLILAVKRNVNNILESFFNLTHKV